MLRLSLLISGLLIVINQKFFLSISEGVQTYIFLIGIIALGIPHGAADLLISKKDANDNRILFSYPKFFVVYIGRLLGFFLLLLFMPTIGIILFILIAAFHFGETDLYKFDTHSFKGKLFSLSYGLVITGVILLTHFEQVSTLLLLLKSGKDHVNLISWAGHFKFAILSVLILFFFFTVFIYFSGNTNNPDISGKFILNLAVIVLIVYNLPLLLGFTFYFVLWHSVMSLKNITTYLQKAHDFSVIGFIKQISLYSLLAMAGITMFGMAGFMFLNHNTLVIYVFLGLAVLTAPHVQVMHTMYYNIHADK